MSATLHREGLSRATLLGPLALSLGIAALVCLDPFATAQLNYSWLEKFPYTITAGLALAAVALALMVMNGAALWTHKETIACVAMFCGAQMIGLNLAKLDPLEMITVPVTLLWLALILNGQIRTVRAGGMLMLIGGFVLSTLLALVDESPILFALGLAGISVKFFDAFLLAQFLRTERILRACLNGFMVVAVVSSLIGIVQVTLQLTTGYVFTLSDTTENLFKSTPWGPVLRATALCPKPQHLSGFLLFALPMMLFAAFEPGRSRKSRFLIVTGIVLTCTATVLTIAVGAWVTLVLVVLLFLYLRWPSRAIHITAVLSLVVMTGWASGLFGWAYARYLAHSGILRGGEQRMFLLSLAFEKLARNPWIGVGPRQFGKFTGNYRQFPVHDAYFQAATEAGLLGGLLYAAILGYAGLRLLRLCAGAAAGADKRFCRMLLLALFALFWNGVAEPTYDHTNTWVSLGLLEGAIVTLGYRRQAAAPLSVPAAAAAGA